MKRINNFKFAFNFGVVVYILFSMSVIDRMNDQLIEFEVQQGVIKGAISLEHPKAPYFPGYPYYGG